MKTRFCVILLSFSSFISFGKKSDTTSFSKDTFFIGMYLKNVYDFQTTDFSFDADFYLWIRSKQKKHLFDIEIVNSRQFTMTDSSTDIITEANEEYYIGYEDCKAKLTHNWELKNYPFDRQNLRIVIEDQYDTNKYLLLSDSPKQLYKLDSPFIVPGWHVDTNYVVTSIKSYACDFGYHNYNGITSFSRFEFVVEISRNSWGLFFKLFSGLYIAFFVSFLAFFIKASHVDPRFGLSIGGLFAAVANKYVADSNIPSTISFSLVDKIHFVSFAFILATLILSAISLKLIGLGKSAKSYSFDKWSSVFIFITYIFINVFLIWSA